MLHQLSEQIKYTLDGLSALGVVATLIGWLPPLAAFLSVIWVSLQIYDRLKFGPKR